MPCIVLRHFLDDDTPKTPIFLCIIRILYNVSLLITYGYNIMRPYG